MKKIVLASLVSTMALMADVTTVTPYVGTTTYDKAATKSLKDSAQFGGIYTSVGNLDYLLELSYNYMNIKYKDAIGIDNLVQNDVTLKYGAYYKNHMLKIGLHYINNNEKETFRDLGSGAVGIIGIAGYNWFGSDKLTYGIDAYYSAYLHAHDDKSLTSTQFIDVVQFTPYLAFSKVISPTTRNDLSLKVNGIAASQYTKKTYLSYELSDTFVYKSFYTTLRYFGGEMKSGVIDGGMTVFNTKDLLTNSYSAKVGYYLTPSWAIDASYQMNNYKEYNAGTLQLLPEGSNSVALVSMSYSF